MQPEIQMRPEVAAFLEPTPICKEIVQCVDCRSERCLDTDAACWCSGTEHIVLEQSIHEPQFINRSESWPLIAERLGRLRRPGELGLGDTIHRVLSWMGGNQFKWLMTKIGINCGCADRQEWLNNRFNYSTAAIWRPVEESIQPPTSDLLLITVGIDDYSKVLDVSRPWLKAYAEKCGADYIELTNKTQDWWGLEKFRVKSFQKHYQRILFMDCDVLPKLDAPNLFELVPEGKIGIHDDYEYIRRGDDNNLRWVYAEREGLFGSQGVVGDVNRATVLNTGVILCDASHDIWNGMKRPFPQLHCDEQFWIERQCEGHSVFKLPTTFNTQWWMRDFTELKKQAHFVHYANSKDRVNDMRLEIESWNA